MKGTGAGLDSDYMRGREERDSTGQCHGEHLTVSGKKSRGVQGGSRFEL